MTKKNDRYVDIWIDNKKRCPVCLEYKVYSEFGKSKYNKNGLTTYCKKCISAVNKKDQKKNGSAFYNMIMKLYGITRGEYNTLLAKQSYSCAICGNQDSGYRLSVDHSHVDGKIRGLLCRKCNHLLGNAKDSVSILQSSILYLQRANT